MTGTETNFSSLIIGREVERTDKLDNLLVKISAIAIEETGYSRSAYLRSKRQNRDDETEYEVLGIPGVHVFAAEDLCVPLFERHAPIAMGLSPLYARVVARLSSPYRDEQRPSRREIDADSPPVRLPSNPLHTKLRQAALPLDIPNPQKLTVEWTGVQQMSDVRESGKNYHFSFIPECPSSDASLLSDEASIIAGAISKMEDIGHEVLYPGHASNVQLCFMEVPKDVYPESLGRMIVRIQEECLPVSTVLGPINWGMKSRGLIQ